MKLTVINFVIVLGFIASIARITLKKEYKKAGILAIILAFVEIVYFFLISPKLISRS